MGTDLPRDAEPAPTCAVRQHFSMGETGETPHWGTHGRGMRQVQAQWTLWGLFSSKDDGEGDGVIGVKKFGHQEKEDSIPVSAACQLEQAKNYFL